MAKEVTRYVKREIERELWARAAGRCQFDGCNHLLFRSPVTQEKVNISEKAHIYSISETGPRGWGPFATNKTKLNELSNLMLVCHDCHKIIDQDEKGERYSPELLRKWKEQHERRIEINTGIDPSKKSHVVLYGANIGEQTSKLQPMAAMDALFPYWNPAKERCIHLSMSWEGKDSEEAYWKTEASNLKIKVNQQIRPVLEVADSYHLSIFALAPIPLLIKLGSLLTDKIPAQVYQLHREPFMIWKWLDGPDDFSYQVKQPESFEHPPALVISLSDSISYTRVTAILGDDISIWELTIEHPHNDFLRSKEQLSLYRETIRKLMVNIGKAHKKCTPLAIFPAMPVACAVELGRVRMPKADCPWIIYDQSNKHKKFIRALEIGGKND